MIRRILFNNITYSLTSLCRKERISVVYYHSDSIEDNAHDEPPDEEQRLSSHEATKILRTHEASIDLEPNCPVKHYEVNYLGANNPPGKHFYL